MDSADAHRAMATLHGFRFFGLAFLLPGVVGPALPARFAGFAAYGDFATGLLALLALLVFRLRPLFWIFVAAFNVVGFADLVGDYAHAVQLGLPAIAGQFGAMYVVPVIYVPRARRHRTVRKPAPQRTSPRTRSWIGLRIRFHGTLAAGPDGLRPAQPRARLWILARMRSDRLDDPRLGPLRS